MSDFEAAYLANAVSAYATVGAGLITLMLALLMTRQPWRWLFVYFCIAVTGVAAIWFHGFREPFAARVVEIGANLLLVWAIQVAIVGELYPGRLGRLINLVVGLANLEVVVTLAASGAKGGIPLVLASDSFGGIGLGDFLLILNCLVAVALLYARRSFISPGARPLLYITTLVFFAGLVLAVAPNSSFPFRTLAYHATWHVVGAFGFVTLWAFNEMRFSLEQYEAEEPVEEEEEAEVATQETSILARPSARPV
jgi:hypothetical protein